MPLLISFKIMQFSSICVLLKITSYVQKHFSVRPSSFAATAMRVGLANALPPFLPPSEAGLPWSPPCPSTISPCSAERVTQFIKKHVASCMLVSNTNTELSYILPSEAVKKGCFERLFQVGAGIS